MNFENNTIYNGFFTGDVDNTFKVRVCKVGEKTLTFEHPQTHEVTRAKIHHDSDGEPFFYPMGKYSMAPVIRPSRKAKPEPEKVVPMPRPQLNLVVLESGYQRNGVSGEGFHVYRIKVDGQTLIATINDEREPESCRVVDPLDLSSGWRGDVIGAALRERVSK